ncbi:adenosylhomocysteine nucleosidase [Firmicutes bacterium CAG:552]|nr:adenosylhomocysteine nucleosidase [Firmicutes bacterium CAG:552]
MTGIICALDGEAKKIRELMSGVTKKTILCFDFYTGKIFDKDVVLTLSGVGKVYAGAVTAVMLSSFDVSEVINLGTCGGIVGTGTQIVAKNVVQYDFDTTAFGDELGCLQGFDSPFIPCSSRLIDAVKGDAIVGTIATGDKFVSSKADIEFLKSKFNAIGFDMESGAIAQICRKCGTEFVIVRAVSDGGDASEYERLAKKAADDGADLVENYLKNA